MPYSVTITKEMEKTAGGGCTALLTALASDAFADSGMFILQDGRTMLHDKDTPLFYTVANPCLLAEFPLDAPEWAGHFYRTDTVQLTFPTIKEYDVFTKKLDAYIALLCAHMTIVADDDCLGREEYTVDEHPIVLKVTKNPIPYRRFIIELEEPDKQLIVRDGGSVGILFEDICPFSEISALGEVTSEDGWRTNTIDLIAYSSTVSELRNAVLARLRA